MRRVCSLLLLLVGRRQVVGSFDARRESRWRLTGARARVLKVAARALPTVATSKFCSSRMRADTRGARRNDRVRKAPASCAAATGARSLKSRRLGARARVRNRRAAVVSDANSRLVLVFHRRHFFGAIADGAAASSDESRRARAVESRISATSAIAIDSLARHTIAIAHSRAHSIAKAPF